MDILFLTQFYWPEARTAPTNLAAMAEDLQSKGHRVTVITGFPNHPFGKVYSGYKIRPWQWEEIRGVRVLRLPLFPDHSTSSIRRAFNYGSFALSASTLGVLHSLDLKTDVLYVYLPPLTMSIPAVILRRLLKAPIVYWITDLWPESLTAARSNLDSRMYRLIWNIANWAYANAETICVNSPGFRRNLIRKGVLEDRIRVVYDWADEDLFFPVQPDANLSQSTGLTGKFNVVYGGNLGTVQGLETVLAAAEQLVDVSDIQIVFIGDGNAEQELKQQVADKHLSNVRFIPRQPMEEIHRFFALADVLLVHLKRKPIFELQIPSKTIAYLACGRPILCAVPGAAATVVREAGAGIVCPSEEPRAMAESIRELYMMPRAKREAMGQRGRQAYLQKYTRQVQVDRVERILKEAVGRGRSARERKA
jgi:glycosyltransferase involved in cell wall biosynthesis